MPAYPGVLSARKSGNHNLYIGRSKNIYEELKKFLEEEGFDVGQSNKGGANILGVTSEVIANLIELIETKFEIA